MAGFNAEVRIPDLWYDVYARLLPGSVFVAVVRYCVVGNVGAPSAPELLPLGMAAYICGLAIHPLSAVVTRRVFLRAESSIKEDFVLDVQHQLRATSSHEVRILQKLHGEVAFFVQLSVLSLIVAIGDVWVEFKGPWPGTWLPITTMVASLLGALEVAKRRVKRAKRLATQFGLPMPDAKGPKVAPATLSTSPHTDRAATHPKSPTSG